jgi:membrane protein implicated in regulation of membrane protease activity
MRPFAPLQGGLVGPETLPLLLLVSGLGLAIAEALAPGAHFIVLGLALLGAGAVGVAGTALGFPVLASPFVLALLVLLFGALSFYGYRNVGLGDGEGERTIDSDSLRGATGRVTQRVTPTSGEVKLEDGGFSPFYSARSVDGEIPEGAEVIVVDPGGGNVLTVESLSGGVDDIDRELARARAARTREEPDGGRETDPEPEPERETERETDPG